MLFKETTKKINKLVYNKQWCKSNKEKYKKYRERYKKRKKEYDKKYYKLSKVKVRRKQSLMNNPNQQKRKKEYAKKYYQKNKDNILEKQKINKKNKRSRYVKKQQSRGEKYNPERSSNPIKIEINNIVAKEAAKLSGEHILLESEKLLTLKTFQKEGVNLENVYVPNPYEKTYKKIKAFHKNTRLCYFGGMLDKIGKRKENRETLATAFPDYCCSINGNKEMNPFSDIEKLFKYKLFKDDSRLSYTFCQRGINSTTTYTNQNMLKVITHTQKMAFKYGYMAELIEEHIRVYDGMFFNTFKIKKL